MVLIPGHALALDPDPALILVPGPTLARQGSHIVYYLFFLFTISRGTYLFSLEID